MKIVLLFPGKIKPRPLASAQDEYIRRLISCGVEVVEYKDERVGGRAAEQTKEAEADQVVKLLKEGDFLIACDERGKAIKTVELAELINASRRGDHPFTGKRRIVVVVGGALGLAETLRGKADVVWSLSSLVLAGGVARIVLLEGLYRAITIVDGHPYHNE